MRPNAGARADTATEYLSDLALVPPLPLTINAPCLLFAVNVKKTAVGLVRRGECSPEIVMGSSVQTTRASKAWKVQPTNQVQEPIHWS